MGTNLPAIDNVLDSLCITRSELILNVINHPLNEVVLKCPLDQLVEEIWGQQFIDLCPGKCLGKWLLNTRVRMRQCEGGDSVKYRDPFNNTVVLP